jgi:hypothetical protein
MSARWTPEARAAVEHSLLTADGDAVDAAIAYAEQLAADAGSSIVDTDLWRRSWAVVSRARRVAKHHPPMIHHDTETPDAT